MKLMDPLRFGLLEAKNRVAMAPMTRSRSPQDNAPSDLNALYYSQRATAGLIINEATQISAQGVGYPWTPGIHTEKQVQGWKSVTHAVHEKGGLIFCQLFHAGRISHPVFHGGDLPVAPSAIAPKGQTFTPEGLQDFVTPRALETAEIAPIVEQYAQAARMAVRAGFDGVEVHAANGYLPNQFLCDGTNRRTDEYGGSLPNRCRFVLEIARAVIQAVGNGRTGLRLSPSGTFNSMSCSDPLELFTYLIQELDKLELAYLHLMEPMEPVDQLPQYPREVTKTFRPLFSGPLITNGGYGRDSGEAAVAGGLADMVAYGKPYISNPDLVERFIHDAPLAPWDESTFYGGGEKGYTDYPFLNQGGEAAP